MQFQMFSVFDFVTSVTSNKSGVKLCNIILFTRKK